MTQPLLELKDLSIEYQTSQGPLTAVSNVSLDIRSGEYYGLVGESGCGKSTVIKSIIGGLDDNGDIRDGEILYKGEPIHTLSESELNKNIRWKEISLIPQSSMNSLDPLRTISSQAIELAEVHTDLNKQEALERIKDLFEIVGLQQTRVSEYPHQFSGGMQQRAIIALALFLEPELIIADEPTTALDVMMQDQVFRYLDRVQQELGTSMMLITHDISLVFESCQRMTVMHAGQAAESGTVVELFDNPRHPYTILLQRAFPDVRFPDRELEEIEGFPPQEFGEINYCTFVARCPWAIEECEASSPTPEPVGGSDTHRASCFRKDEVLELYREESTIGGIHD